MGYTQRPKETGFSTAFASSTQTSFDTPGDYYKGTNGLMLDKKR
jgi:hypothetical protein